ncbi:PmbA/TldA family metallopeptidase, partial [Acidobacteriota bacterium]
MKKLLEKALNVADSVDILTWKSRVLPVQFQDHRFEGVTFTDSYNVALRIIKDGKLGTSYGDSLESRDTLIEQAVKSAKYGDNVEYDFSHEPIRPLNFENYDGSVTEQSLDAIASETLELVDFFKKNGVDSTVRAGATMMTTDIRFLNSKGIEGKSRRSLFNWFSMLVLPGSGIGPIGFKMSHTRIPFPEEKKATMLEDYKHGLKQTGVPTRRMKLLAAPVSWTMFKWRFERAVSAQSLC